jgi:lysophospholipase L1-like esterase
MERSVQSVASSTNETPEPARRSALPVFRFLGLGDSLTEGVGDPRPGRAGFAGELDGWVTHFADAVRNAGQSVAVRNFAVAGSRIPDVMNDQLALALNEPADMISCFIGINDLWDANLDLDEFAQRFNQLFTHLSSSAPVVVTATIHDIFEPFRVRPPVREKLHRNIETMNVIIRNAAADYDLVLIDLANRADMFTSSVRAIDRLHPNRYGHQLIAVEVLDALQQRGMLVDVKAPTAEPIGHGTHDLAHIAWVAKYVGRNWRRWRSEMAATKLREAESASSTSSQ